jgi:hypothetical protein
MRGVFVPLLGRRHQGNQRERWYQRRSPNGFTTHKTNIGKKLKKITWQLKKIITVTTYCIVGLIQF